MTAKIQEVLCPGSVECRDIVFFPRLLGFWAKPSKQLPEPGEHLLVQILRSWGHFLTAAIILLVRQVLCKDDQPLTHPKTDGERMARAARSSLQNQFFWCQKTRCVMCFFWLLGFQVGREEGMPEVAQGKSWKIYVNSGPGPDSESL